MVEAQPSAPVTLASAKSPSSGRARPIDLPGNPKSGRGDKLNATKGDEQGVGLELYSHPLEGKIAREERKAARKNDDATSGGEGWRGAPAATMYTAELCAGSAGLSMQLARVGLATVAVDHKFNKHAPKVPCVRLDLSKESGWTILWKLLEQGRLLYCHGAPPCGTASRAREKKVPFSCEKEVHPSRHRFARRLIRVVCPS